MTTTVLAVLIALAPATTALALPDLMPEIYELSVDTNQTVTDGEVLDGCSASTAGRTLVRFGVRSWNVGTDPLVIGATGCPECTADNMGAACTNPSFECSPSGTPRAVFLSSSTYELLDMAGNVVVTGAKRNYCFHDDCVPPDQRTFNDCQNDQGVSVGCFDDYEPELACQYLDATDVPGIGSRAFRLRVTIDPESLLPDANRGNNVTEVVIPGCGDGVVQDGEECDPGTSVAGTCCDPTCHVAAAGTPCRAARDACDAPEACDGTSASCPADVPAPDGTPCGTSAPPCATSSCRAGACALQQDSAAGCFVDDACFAPDAADPADGCKRCDPSANPSGWTAVRDADAAGVRCGLERAMGGIGSCSGHPGAVLRARLRRAEKLAARLSSSRPHAVRVAEARLLRVLQQARRVVRRNAACAGGGVGTELDDVRSALRAMRGQG
jgi:hypothetical protein